MFASLFVLLYLGHLLADYPLQTDHQAAHKADRCATGWAANLTHAATHVTTCAVAPPSEPSFSTTWPCRSRSP